MALGIRTTRDGGRTTVTALGSIDLQSFDDLQQHLVALVDHGESEITVDLSGVEFCDSSGLNALVHGYKHAKAHGGKMRVVGAKDKVARLLAVTRLDRMLLSEETSS